MSYQTQQRKALVRLLTTTGRAMTAKEIVQQLSQIPDCPTPSTSTVYRLLGKLTSEGVTKAFLNDSTPRSMLYQMDGKHACHAHLHLKCQDCGKLYHLDTDKTTQVLDTLRTQCGFVLDAAQTTLFGCCAQCEQR